MKYREADQRKSGMKRKKGNKAVQWGGERTQEAVVWTCIM